MLCQSCLKLSFQYIDKKCVRCKGEVLVNLAILCENCSSQDKSCAVCLKKVDPSAKKVLSSGGCRCGSK